MTFELYERVKVKRNGVVGQIIDITERETGAVYVVESDEKGYRDDADYPSLWPMYYCTEHEIEKM